MFVHIRDNKTFGCLTVRHGTAPVLMYLVPHFGHAKVYETSIWTPCFQILAKTMIHACINYKSPVYFMVNLLG